MLAGLSLNLAVLLGPPEGEDEPRLAVVQVPGAAPAPRAAARRRGPRPRAARGRDLGRAREPLPRAGDPRRGRLPHRARLRARLRRRGRPGLPAGHRGGAQEPPAQRGRPPRGGGRGLRSRSSPSSSRGSRSRPDDVYRIRGPVDVRPLLPLVDLPALEDLRDTPAQAPARDRGGGTGALRPPRRARRGPPPPLRLVRPGGGPDVGRPPRTPTCSPSSRPSTGRAATRRSCASLARAAENGKQVTVLVELLARFDEQSNIRWARRLEESGCHVIYGIRGYKTHSKIALVVRRGRQGIRRYVHLGTGNYNEKTARLYTDFGLMTSDREIGEDASAFFNALTGYSDPPRMKKLVMAPTHLRDRVLRLVNRERQRAEAGSPGRDPRQDELARGRGDHPRPLRRGEGGRADPPRRARDLLPAARPQGHERLDRGRLGRGPLPRALADLPLPERRRRGGLPLERGLDAAEPRQAHRAPLPRGVARGAAEGAPRPRRDLPGQREGAPAAGGRDLQAPPAGEGRGSLPLADRAAPGGEARRRTGCAPGRRSRSSPCARRRSDRDRRAAPDRPPGALRPAAAPGPRDRPLGQGPPDRHGVPLRGHPPLRGRPPRGRRARRPRRGGRDRGRPHLVPRHERGVAGEPRRRERAGGGRPLPLRPPLALPRASRGDGWRLRPGEHRSLSLLGVPGAAPAAARGGGDRGGPRPARAWTR